jgi:hypothetical protein
MAMPTVRVLPGTILRVDFHEDLTVEDVKSLMLTCEPLFNARRKGGEHIVSVSDIDKIKPNSTEARRALAAGLMNLAKRFPGVWVGEGVIASSAVARALITGFWWWRNTEKDGVRRMCFDTEAAALNWARQVLAQVKSDPKP